MDASRVAAFLLPMLMLLWVIYTGYELATETQSIVIQLESRDTITRYAFFLGALTVIFGLVSFILGLSLVAELALALSSWSEDDTKAGNAREKEQKNFCHVLVRISVTAISVFMLIWTSYYGYKLAQEPLEEGKLIQLSFLVGIIAIAFGLTNFLIGIAILADYGKSFPADLQEKFFGFAILAGSAKSFKADLQEKFGWFSVEDNSAYVKLEV